MPISSLQARLRQERFDMIVERARERASGIPDEGETAAAFAYTVLSDLEPFDHGEVLNLLHRRKIIALTKRDGHVRVHRKPPIRAGYAKERTPLDRLLADIAPRTLALGRAIEVERPGLEGTALAEAREAVFVEARGIVKECRKRALDVPLADMREALATVLPAAILREVIYQEQRLARDSDAETLVDQAMAATTRLPRGLDTAEKVRLVIERAGREGITQKALRASVRPLMTLEETHRIADDLEARGRIIREYVKVARVGRKGLRYFAVEAGAPDASLQSQVGS